MGASQISRFSDSTSVSVTFTDTASTTGGFVMSVHSGAMLLVKSASSATVQLSFGTRLSKEDADYYGVSDSVGVPATLTVSAGKAYPLPDALFAARYVTATTPSGQTVTCDVVMKG